MMVRLAWPEAKLAVPVGKAPPMKSAADVGVLPVPAAAHATLAGWSVVPVRVMVNS